MTIRYASQIRNLLNYKEDNKASSAWRIHRCIFAQGYFLATNARRPAHVHPWYDARRPAITKNAHFPTYYSLHKDIRREISNRDDTEILPSKDNTWEMMKNNSKEIRYYYIYLHIIHFIIQNHAHFRTYCEKVVVFCCFSWSGVSVVFADVWWYQNLQLLRTIEWGPKGHLEQFSREIENSSRLRKWMICHCAWRRCPLD